MKSACSGDVRPTAPSARHRSVAHPTPRRRVLGACALAPAGILYGASTEPLAWVMSGGVDAEGFLSIRFAFAAGALLLFCRGPVADPVALLKAGSTRSCAGAGAGLLLLCGSGAGLAAVLAASVLL